MPRARGVVGAAAGLWLAYGAVRTLQALRDLRDPAPPIAVRAAKRYGDARRGLAIADITRGVAGLAAAAFACADPLERGLSRLPRPLRAPAFAAAALAFDALYDTGVAYVEEHAFERRWGLTEQSPHAWLADRAKGTAVALAVSAGLVALGDAVVARAPRRWPWIAIAGTAPLLALATVIAPTFVMPLFNRYEPVAGELETRIRALATRYGAGGARVLRFDMSRQTTKANAFVTGVWGTQRIALGDTLVERFPSDEALFVVAHELGHYVRRDPWTGIAAGTVAVAVTLLLADSALRRTTGRALDGPAQGTRLLFYATLVTLALSPAGNALSRALERRADRFAVAATADPDAGIRAFRRLAQQNLAEFEPPRWAQLLLASHPSLAERIRLLESL